MAFIGNAFTFIAFIHLWAIVQFVGLSYTGICCSCMEDILILILSACLRFSLLRFPINGDSGQVCNARNMKYNLK